MKLESPGDLKKEAVKILFVCAGNICRSPLADGIFQNLVNQHGVADRFVIDSAGTGAWHVGQKPDRRMRQTARNHGVSLDDIRARQFDENDLQNFDHIFVMDKENLHDVLFLDPRRQWENKVRLFRELDPLPGDYQVPDPYYGGDAGFENVFTMIDRTSRVLLDRLLEASES